MRGLAFACLLTLLPFVAFAAGDARVAPSAADVEPLEVGASIPDVELKTPEGRTVALANLTGEKPVVLVFYRGGW
ncbi:MAG: hypothetical protein ACR2PQ_01105 [Myxococcota bacterium]